MKRAKILTFTSVALAALLLATGYVDASVRYRLGSAEGTDAAYWQPLATPRAIDAVQVFGQQQHIDRDQRLAFAWGSDASEFLVFWNASDAPLSGTSTETSVSYRICATDFHRADSHGSYLGWLHPSGMPDAVDFAARPGAASTSRTRAWFPPFAFLTAASLLLCFVTGGLVKEQVQAVARSHGARPASMPHAIAKLILQHAPKFLQPQEAIQAATSMGMSPDEAAAELAAAEGLQGQRTSWSA